MNLEEIRKLSDDDLGQALINAVADCASPKYQNYDYCNELEAIAEVEKIVVEKSCVEHYACALVDSTGRGFSGAVVATARERAEACLLALQSL